MSIMRQYPGLEILIEELRKDSALLDMAIRDVPEPLHEILYSTLLGMTAEDRQRLLNICITHPSKDRSFLIETIGNGLLDKRTGLYNRTKFNTDLKAAIDVVDHLYIQRGEHVAKAVISYPQHPPENRLRIIEPFIEPFPDVSLLILDVDHFKGVNDVYGHPVGDRALQLVAEIVRQSLRSEDHQRLYRYGGEEFAVLLPYTSVDQGARIAKRICDNVADKLENALPAQNGHSARGITVSIGIANYRATTAKPADLVEQADIALYAAKDAGRNCVKIYNPEMLETTRHNRYWDKRER